MDLRVADFLFTTIHLVIIGFNLTGWLWERTRKLHFCCILLTAAFVDTLTAVGFVLAAALSVYVNFSRKYRAKAW